jgi:hypothetical protein
MNTFRNTEFRGAAQDAWNAAANAYHRIDEGASTALSSSAPKKTD